MSFKKGNGCLARAAGRRALAKLLIFLLVAFGIASGQAPAANPSAHEIRDPNLHIRWMLVRNSAVPGGPGYLMEIHGQGSGSEGDGSEKRAPSPVIRTRDHIRVEQHTPVLDAVLEGMALETAAPGETLRVRLTVDGRVVRTFALAPGRATLAPDSGAWR